MSIGKNSKKVRDKQVLNEKYCLEKYSSYNQITKDYDVYTLSNEEYDKLSQQDKKEVKYMVLKKKNKVSPPDPKGPPV